MTIKAVLAGGGMPHRLGLSETVLVFDKHLLFCGGIDGFVERFDALRARVPEKLITVEVESIADAVKLARAGVDAVQLDKLPAAELARAVRAIKEASPRCKVLAAGGITPDNAAEHAAAGADVLVTSAVFFGKPADICTSIEPR